MATVHARCPRDQAAPLKPSPRFGQQPICCLLWGGYLAGNVEMILSVPVATLLTVSSQNIPFCTVPFASFKSTTATSSGGVASRSATVG